MTNGARVHPVPDAALGYERNRTAFAPGQALVLDDNYRLAHLPLVGPNHPRVIPRVPARDYEFGCHPETVSLVLPVDPDLLEGAAAYAELVADIRSQGFSRKVAWDILPRRRERLHATLCGGLGPGGLSTPEQEALRQALAASGRFQVELRGLFSGNVNVGRLYLKLYPEQRGGENCIAKLQRSLSKPETGLYVVGLLNLVDDLDRTETAELAALIARWWDRPLLRFEVRELWLLGARDDLALDARVVERVALP